VTFENFRSLRLEGRAFLAGAAQQLGLELGRYLEDNGSFFVGVAAGGRIHEWCVYITSIYFWAEYFTAWFPGVGLLIVWKNWANIWSTLKTARKTRAIAVQLAPQTVKKLDQLAEHSRMSRHRYMIVVLERAVKANVVVREQLAFSDE
jgi:hypothetical protein